MATAPYRFNARQEVWLTLYFRKYQIKTSGSRTVSIQGIFRTVKKNARLAEPALRISPPNPVGAAFLPDIDNRPCHLN
jgi:hypothetical protein